MPGLDDLPELIKGFRAAGLNIDFTLRGVAPERGASGGQGRDLAIYRTVQEALTNTLRYAGAGSSARVVISQGSDGTKVSVTDDGGLPGNRPMTGLGSGRRDSVGSERGCECLVVTWSMGRWIPVDGL